MKEGIGETESRESERERGGDTGKAEGIFSLTFRAPGGYKRAELRGESVPVRSRGTFSSFTFRGLWRSWERA